MGLFQRKKQQDEKLVAVEKFLEERNTLFQMDSFLSKKTINPIIDNYAELFDYFSKAEGFKQVEQIAKTSGMKKEVIFAFLTQYRKFTTDVATHNDKFVERKLIEKKEYLDKILAIIDPSIQLDEDQRRVVLRDEDNTLVIAGAGAGKTTTIAAKVKYLVDIKGVDPSKILVISYTNKAVDELKDRIIKQLKIDCPITTFHSAGYAIIRRQMDQNIRVVDGGFLHYVTREYVKKTVFQNESLTSKLLLFFSTYFEIPCNTEDPVEFINHLYRAEYSTLKSNLNEYVQEMTNRLLRKKQTINSEIVRSMEEVQIANFLYLRNIMYAYEPVYPYHIQGAQKVYTPDFMIVQGEKRAYIEHFGISEAGENRRYQKDELERYIQNMEHKIQLHRKHDTNLIVTYSSYLDNRPMLEHLEEELLKRGFVLEQKDEKTVLEKLVRIEENKYVFKFVKLVANFIEGFKTKGLKKEDFMSFHQTTENVRTKLFLELCYNVYLEYERALKESNRIDFSDMINEASFLLEEAKKEHVKIDFDYIIVDEYQDVSRQRFNLTKVISEVTDAKVMAVGDDWQSIFAFAGSDITLFTRFKEFMGEAEQLIIRYTYRNAQEVIDIAGDFVQKNSEQLRKMLISPKHLDDPLYIVTYENKNENDFLSGSLAKGLLESRAEAVEKAIAHILENRKNENKSHKILLIGRYNFDAEAIGKTEYFTYDSTNSVIISKKYPKLELEFLTAHSSKGLGYDDVIIINALDHYYGFPAKIENDPILQFVYHHDRSIDYAEERRLFYVAMTRTKNRVYIVAPAKKASEFAIELAKDYPKVKIVGKLYSKDKDKTQGKPCPICGYPLQLRYKSNFGLRLFICTNEPEVCSFMTNDLKGEKMSIMKCSECIDGYLVVQSFKNTEPFLGCTGYQRDKTGCNKRISKKQYYAKYHLTDSQIVVEETTSLNHIEQEIAFSAFVKEASQIKTSKEIITIDEESKLIPETLEEHSNLRSSRLNHAQNHILKCIEELPKPFGTIVVARILIGERVAAIRENKLDQLTMYNRLSTYSLDNVIFLINDAIDKGFIHQTDGKYPTLELTNSGKDEVVKLGDKLEFVAQSIEEIKKRLFYEENIILLYLKQARKKIADRVGKQPRLVIYDDVLKRLASRRPKTLDKIRKVIGSNSYLKGEDYDYIYRIIMDEDLIKYYKPRRLDYSGLLLVSNLLTGIVSEINSYYLTISIPREITVNNFIDYLIKEEILDKKTDSGILTTTKKGIDLGFSLVNSSSSTNVRDVLCPTNAKQYLLEKLDEIWHWSMQKLRF